MIPSAYQPLYLIPRKYTAIVNPRGAARAAAEQAAIAIVKCGAGETWYVVPDARMREVEEAGQDSAGTEHGRPAPEQ